MTRRVAVLAVAVTLLGTTRASADELGLPVGPARVLQVLAHIASTLRVSSYRHDPRVVQRDRYEFDCSSMATWVLGRSAPRALAAVAREGNNRLVAADYVRTIRHAQPNNHRHGWQRVDRVADARAGDVVAWERPPWFPSHNTGHVAFVLGTPVPFEHGVLIRVADSSSYNHENDTRRGGTGYGEGTILITTDAVTGAGSGYGWFGSQSGAWIIPTPVVIGRPLD